MSANDKHLKSETQFEGIFVKEFCSAHQEIERKGSATHERTYLFLLERVNLKGVQCPAALYEKWQR